MELDKINQLIDRCYKLNQDPGTAIKASLISIHSDINDSVREMVSYIYPKDTLDTIISIQKKTDDSVLAQLLTYYQIFKNELYLGFHVITEEGHRGHKYAQILVGIFFIYASTYSVAINGEEYKPKYIGIHIDSQAVEHILIKMGDFALNRTLLSRQGLVKLIDLLKPNSTWVDIVKNENAPIRQLFLDRLSSIPGLNSDDMIRTYGIDSYLSQFFITYRKAIKRESLPELNEDAHWIIQDDVRGSYIDPILNVNWIIPIELIDGIGMLRDILSLSDYGICDADVVQYGGIQNSVYDKKLCHYQHKINKYKFKKNIMGEL
jgi:hypothetical protein